MATQSMHKCINKQVGKEGDNHHGLNGLILGEEDELDQSKMITFDQIYAGGYIVLALW